MEVLPENEKIIKLDQGDEEGWVDTHHGIGEVGRVGGAIGEVGRMGVPLVRWGGGGGGGGGR